MHGLVDVLPVLFASAKGATYVMQSYVTPAAATLSAIAGLVSTFFLVMGGVRYMTSRGNPEKLGQAKTTIKNALLGLVLVIAAATLVSLLSHAYDSPGATASMEKLPDLVPVTPNNGGFPGAIISAITGFLNILVQAAAGPFLSALEFFLKGTPLMADNSGVFNLWLTIVAIADLLFVLVVALLGFHVMSFSTLGFEEVDIKRLLPQFVLAFLLINTSIFAIDVVINLSNVMIRAVSSGGQVASIWTALQGVMGLSGGLGVVALIVMVTMLIVAFILLIYYVGRIMALYLGAVLSPLIVLLWLLPAFKDFAITALKAYLVTIFVLFVHIVILLIAALMLVGVVQGNLNGQPNSLTSLLVGLAAMIALLKTQGVMQELTYAASGPRTARELAGSFIRGVSATRKVATSPYTAAAGAVKTKRKVVREADKNKSKPNSTSSTIVHQVRATGGGSDTQAQGGNRPDIPMSGRKNSPRIPTGTTREEKQRIAQNGE